MAGMGGKRTFQASFERNVSFDLAPRFEAIAYASA
jgi:hypothetical protein